jgi:hypothetical protein
MLNKLIGGYGRAASQLAKAANIGHNILAVSMDVMVGDRHIPGESNWQCDGLSRGPEVGLSSELEVVLSDDTVWYIQLCDPARSNTSSSRASSWRRWGLCTGRQHTNLFFYLFDRQTATITVSRFP